MLNLQRFFQWVKGVNANVGCLAIPYKLQNVTESMLQSQQFVDTLITFSFQYKMDRLIWPNRTRSTFKVQHHQHILLAVSSSSSSAQVGCTPALHPQLSLVPQEWHVITPPLAQTGRRGRGTQEICVSEQWRALRPQSACLHHTLSAAALHRPSSGLHSRDEFVFRQTP